MTNRLQEMLVPLDGFQEDLNGTTQAVEHLSATVARLEAAVGDLATQIAQMHACEGCPLRVTGAP